MYQANELTHYDKCSVTRMMDIIRPKWTMEIILELLVSQTGSLAFSDFEKLIRGINPRILSTRLHALVRKGIIEKFIPDPSTPKKVRYRLSDKGLEFTNIFLHMRSWAIKYLDVDEQCKNNRCRHMMVIQSKLLDLKLPQAMMEYIGSH